MASIKLEKFSGRHQCTEAWWEQYCQWAVCNNYNDARQLASFVFHLDDPIQLWFRQLNPEQKDTLAHLRIAFCERFKMDTSMDSTLLNSKQETNESSDDYINRLGKLFAYKELPPHLQVAIAVNGLQQRLKTVVIPREPTTLEDVRKSALLAERSIQPASVAAASTTSDSTLTERLKDIERLITSMMTPSQG